MTFKSLFIDMFLWSNLYVIMYWINDSVQILIINDIYIFVCTALQHNVYFKNAALIHITHYVVM